MGNLINFLKHIAFIFGLILVFVSLGGFFAGDYFLAFILFLIGLGLSYKKAKEILIKNKNFFKEKHWKPKAINDEHSKKVFQVFSWSFIFLGTLLILFALLTRFFQYFGIFVGIAAITILSLFIAIIIAIGYAAARRGAQIGDIIEAKHKEIKNKRKN